MIRIYVELVPYGIEERKKPIGEMYIINTGKNKRRPVFGDYRILIKNLEEDTEEELAIKNHNRSDGLWKLLFKIFRKYLNKS